MAQGLLPFQYEVENRGGGMTALSDLPACLELAPARGPDRLVSERVEVHGPGQGCTDERIVTSDGPAKYTPQGRGLHQ
ncbi:MAG: hypothetical protein V2B18_14640 [Pseudomonadota bacterium]